MLKLFATFALIAIASNAKNWKMGNKYLGIQFSVETIEIAINVNQQNFLLYEVKLYFTI